MPSSLPAVAMQAAIRNGGFAAYKLAVIVTNAVSKAILGRGLSFAAGHTLTKTIGIFAGPIGWVLTGVWTLVDIAGPAYRVTVPCVLHIAYLRRKASLMKCCECSSYIEKVAGFCSSCGAAQANV